MSGIDDLLCNIPIPRMARVAQAFERRKVDDVEAELLRGMAAKRVLEPIRRGAAIAVAVGSRGIVNLPDVTRIVVRELKAAGAKPFIVPAMGSHGGATESRFSADLKSRRQRDSVCKRLGQ